MERIRVLFLAANPQATSRLRLGEEAREIQERIALSQGPVDLQTEWAVRIRDLQHLLLKYRPHVVHFSGHGVASGDGVPGSSGGADLVLEDDGVVDMALVSTEALAALFAVHRDSVRCVVLNACHSQRQAAGIARSIDFVIGMSRPVQDQTAIAFAAAFYQGLGFGRSIRDAFEMGRVEARLIGQADYDVPQILLRDGADVGAVLQTPLTISMVKRAIKAALPGRELDAFLLEHFKKEVYWRIVPTMPYPDKLITLFDQVRDLARIQAELEQYKRNNRTEED